jgi:hypothetical protein
MKCFSFLQLQYVATVIGIAIHDFNDRQKESWKGQAKTPQALRALRNHKTSVQNQDAQLKRSYD